MRSPSLRPLRLAAGLALLAAAASAAAEGGYGPWKFGMTRTQVTAVKEFGPYSAVELTGGMETRNGSFEGEKTKISFIFWDKQLQKFILALYEGKDAERAVAAWMKAYRHVHANYGELVFRGFSVPDGADEAAVEAAMRAAVGRFTGDQPQWIQMLPRTAPPEAKVLSSLFRHPEQGYAVLLYFAKP